MILSSTGKPFKNKSGAVNAIRIGKLEGDPIEIEGGWGIAGISRNRDVICPGCGGIYHETTEKFNPDTDVNPSMLKLKKKYRDWGWQDVPPDATCGFGCIECPECGAMMAPDGKLRVV